MLKVAASVGVVKKSIYCQVRCSVYRLLSLKVNSKIAFYFLYKMSLTSFGPFINERRQTQRTALGVNERRRWAWRIRAPKSRVLTFTVCFAKFSLLCEMYMHLIVIHCDITALHVEHCNDLFYSNSVRFHPKATFTLLCEIYIHLIATSWHFM